MMFRSSSRRPGAVAAAPAIVAIVDVDVVDGWLNGSSFERDEGRLGASV